MTLSEIKRIIKLLGPRGAIAGLEASDLTREDLLEIASKTRKRFDDHSDRSYLIDELVSSLNRVDLKPTDELLQMSYEDLVDYFAEASPSNDDLMKVMKELNYKVSAEDKKHLRRFVARQISETALFANVATRNGDNR
ncbi:hypothetical protein [Rhizobium leguminosarum]|uniref:hypothetical protein n=1 Tax=Rhizobium leguminosarum TaxID=384 RepID=UPI0010303C60|nr:hypothetical protein [Rhizobium leguminosarum]TAV90450.1 hypothetical protein ELI22_15000 [Rhizobium leguminosarum]TAV95055.1 hypothetical protein ELI21_15155 [Rhizobium leguminosarum]TAW36133.1 hypothetical protein ELI23_15200 [Rhizobium leguminosarum]